MPQTITYSDGSARPSVVAIRDDNHAERSGFYRAYWSDELDGTGNGCAVVGYCSPGGSHRTIRACVAEVRRMYPAIEICRNGRLLT